MGSCACNEFRATLLIHNCLCIDTGAAWHADGLNDVMEKALVLSDQLNASKPKNV